MSGLRGWADLPEDLLHSIVPRLGSFCDLLAFTATCHFWRAAVSSYPCKSALPTLFPPLLLEFDIPLCSPHARPFSSIPLPERPCHATDLANQDTTLCYQIPLFARFGGSNATPASPDDVNFRGASFGHLILSSKRSFLVIDVFTGASVSSPLLLLNGDAQLYYATLTAPLASPNSHLLVTTGSHNFIWRVGSCSWLRRSSRGGIIKNIAVFRGQVYGMDNVRRLFAVHLAPQICIQKIAAEWERSITSKRHLSHTWLVACGDMLLAVVSQESFHPLSFFQTYPYKYRRTCDIFEAFRLDLSTIPAMWVKVEKLENWAIFLSTDERSQPLCCMNPERWGGRSNCIYCYVKDRKNWVPFELGEPLDENASNRSGFTFTRCFTTLTPMWVVSSMFSSSMITHSLGD